MLPCGRSHRFFLVNNALHTGEVVEIQATDYGAKGKVKTGHCTVPFLVPIHLAYMASDVKVGTVIRYGKDPLGRIRLPIIHEICSQQVLEDAVEHLNDDQEQLVTMLVNSMAGLMDVLTGFNAKTRPLIENLMGQGYGHAPTHG